MKVKTIGIDWSLLFTGISVLMMVVVGTWPVIPLANSSVACDSLISFSPADGDPWLFIWNGYHVKKWILGSEPSVLFSNSLFAPEGLDLTFHTLTLANSIPMALILDIVGPSLAYNFCFLLQSLLTIVGVFFYVRYFGGGKIAALLAAWIFFAAPSRTSHLAEHLNILSTGWIPFATLNFKRWVDDGSMNRLLKACFFLVLASYSSLYYLASCLLIVGMMMLPCIFSRSFIRQWKKRCFALILFIGLGGLCLAPRLIPMLRKTSLGSKSISHVISYSPGIEKLIRFPRTHPLLRSDQTTSHEIETQITTGLSVLFFIAMSLIWGDRRVRTNLGYGAVFYILSLGPTLLLGETPLVILNSTIPLPFGLIRLLPGGSALRCPGRLAITGMLFFAVAVGLSFKTLLKKFRFITVILVGATILELFPAPLPMKKTPLNRYRNIVKNHRGTAFTIPSDWSNRITQFEQMYHHHPLLFGFSARVPEINFLRYENFPIFRKMQIANLTESNIYQSFESYELSDVMTLFGINMVIFYKDQIPCRIDSERIIRAVTANSQIDRIIEDSDRLILDLGSRTNSFEVVNPIRYYFALNWFGVEQWPENSVVSQVRWSQRKRGSIYLFPNTNGTVILTCDLMPSPGERGITRDVEILVHGKKSALIALKEGWNRVELPFLVNLDSSRSFVTIDFSSVYNSVNPHLLSVGDDKRELGLAIKNVSFNVVESDPSGDTGDCLHEINR